VDPSDQLPLLDHVTDRDRQLEPCARIRITSVRGRQPPGELPDATTVHRHDDAGARPPIAVLGRPWEALEVVDDPGIPTQRPDQLPNLFQSTLLGQPIALSGVMMVALSLGFGVLIGIILVLVKDCAILHTGPRDNRLQIGKELGAQAVLVAWVNRMSNLLLTLNYEIREVDSGEVSARGAFDFRGDNDQAWNRAVTYMVQDLKTRMRR
jgi:hypothetical protein